MIQRTLPFLFLAALFVSTSAAAKERAEDPLRVFIRAGVKTHGPGEHDHPRFLEDWSVILAERGAEVAGAQRFPTAEELDATDVMILYAAEGGSIHGEERARLDAFLARGGGLVVLHDAVCGDAPHWFKGVVGGAWEHGHAKWYTGEMGLYFPDREHPITKGVSNFDLTDEIYYELHMDPDAHVIANSFRTTHEIRPQMWVYEKDNYRAFVSIPGHYHDTFSLPPYRTLLLRGIAWAGKRDAGLLVSDAETANLRYPEGGPRTPEAAVEALALHEDFEVEAVATEPLLVNPISIDWDSTGRMWVAVTPGYPYKEEFKGVPAHDQILILEDGDGDGRMDSRTVFFEGLDLVTSLVLHRDGVIVTQAPEILFLRDTDGDDVADVREVLYSGFGYGDTHATMSNLRWGMDGWIYGTQGYSGGASNHVVGSDGVDHGKIGNGLFRFRPDGTDIEMVVSYGSNTWGCDFTWDGELFFTMANGSHLRHVILPDRVMQRGRVGNTPSWKDVTDHTKAFPTVNHDRNPYVQIDFVGGFTGAAGSLIYDGGAWPQEYWGDHFVTEPTINLVHRDHLEPRGATFVASRYREKEFLGSYDLWFRPVHLRTGPDGAMYVLDFYNQAAVHNDTRGPQHGPTNAALRPDRDRHHGRILRVQHSAARDLSVTVGSDPATLVADLARPNRWARMTAQRLMCEAKSLPAGVLAQLEPSASASARQRVHGLWILHQRDALSDAALVAGLSDTSAGVRKNAARIAGSRQECSAEVMVELARLSGDVDPRVVIEAAVALGEQSAQGALALSDLSLAVIGALIERYADLPDDWARSAFVGALAADPHLTMSAVLERSEADSFEGLVREMATRVGRSRDKDQVARFVIVLGAHIEDRPHLVEAALLQLVDSLPGGFMPTPSTELQGALASLLSTDEVEVAIAVLPFASRWDTGGGLGELADKLSVRLTAVLDDEEESPQRRAQCLTTLLEVDSQRAGAIETSVALLQPHVPLDVQERVIELLGQVSDTNAAEVLIAAFPAFSGKLREASFNQLTKRVEWAGAVLDRVEADELSAKDLGPGRVFRLCNHPDATVASRATTLLETQEEEGAMELEELIASLVPVVSQRGDMARGEELFNANCGTCHTYKSAAGKVGPELTGMGVHSPQDLLPYVLDPNRTVEDNYIEYVVRTWDGLSYGGVLVRESDHSVVLRNTGGDVEIAREDIESLGNTGRSPMPTGLQEIGAEGLRDIFTWLRSEFEGYRVLDLSRAATANTLTGLYDPREPRTLEFERFGVHSTEGVPFSVLDPTRSVSGNNVIVLKGGLAGDWHCKTHLPNSVEVPVGVAVKELHVLGGIAAWGFPFTKKGLPAVRVTWHYADGATEEKMLTDGHEFADWIRPIEVPGSTQVHGILRDNSRGQLRRFTIKPSRGEVVSKIVLAGFDGDTAPTFVSLTAELGDPDSTSDVSAQPEDSGAEPSVHTLIVGGGSSHDFRRWFADEDVKTLSALGSSVTYTEDDGTLVGALEDLSLLMLSNNRPMPADAHRGISDFVEAGGGLLLVHPACWYNWNDWPEYNRDLVGGGARGHESYGEFEVRVVDEEHPVMRGVPASFRITDELYRFERDPSGSDIKVLAIGRSLETGEEYPVVWTVARDEGRTTCITLGHDGKAHELPAFKQLLKNSAAWAAREGGE